MRAKPFLQAISQCPYPRAMTSLAVAMFAVLIDLIFRFSDYHALVHVLPVLGSMKFVGALILVFLQVVALFYLLALLPRPFRAGALLISACVLVLQFSFWQTLSQFMTGTDVFLALTVGGENRLEAVSSFFKPLALLYTVPYLVVLSALIFAPRASGFRKTIAFSLLPLLYLFVSSYALFLHMPERSLHLNPLTSFIRATLHYGFEHHREYHGPRDTLPAFHISRRPLDSIIYVIDESVRGSNLSLNGYPRATTPFLQSLETRGLLRNLGICVSAGTLSHLSNAYLLTGHNTFPDKTFQTDKNPTIFDYAKKMGYETMYIDIDQGSLAPLMKAARGAPVRSLDGWMTEQSLKERRINLEITKDVGVAHILSNILNERGGYFVLVNKKGLHFHYRNRYPDDPTSTIWKPVMKTSESIDTSRPGREKLVNTYDNGIRFQVDEFFRVLVSETQNQNYVVLYTSDHGQTLSEDGQVYTHMKPDKVVVDVPEFFVIGTRYDRSRLLGGIRSGIRVSHLNNFPTLLDMMGVPGSLRIRPYEKSIFSLTPEDNKVRYYMAGSLHGSGDYVVNEIPTPPDKNWGVSRPVSNTPTAK